MKPFREKTVGPARRAAAGFSCWSLGRPGGSEEGGGNPATSPLRLGRPCFRQCTSRRVRAASGWLRPAAKRWREGGCTAFAPGSVTARWCHIGQVPVRGDSRRVACRFCPFGPPLVRDPSRTSGTAGAGGWRAPFWAFRGLARRLPDRPVLKHGPRSPPGARVVGCLKPEGAAKA